MTDPRSKPPAWSRACIAWAARRLGTPDLPVDAEDLFVQRFERDGPRRARSWYRRQARAALRRALLLRPSRGSSRPGKRGRSPISWLDVKLGVRMLAKHPGLSLAGGAALAVTIAFGAGLYEFFSEFISIELPFPEGDRIVRVTNWDTEQGSGESRSAADFVSWREDVRSIDPLAALSPFEANVSGTSGVPIPLAGARATAALFEAVGVPPSFGRPLLPSDEVEGAAPVVVVSDDVWRNQLGGAPLDEVFLRIGGVAHEVVGVMPDGFRFPVDHRFWAPLRVASTGQVPREGVPLLVFGRLAPGATMESAQAELTALGRRAAERWPGTHTRLEPRVTAFWGSPGGDWQRWAALGFQTAFGFLLALAALNVAILSFSRTASRQGEIAVRTALGAGRRRIVTQLFAEALVLSGAAAVVGLMVARWVVPRASELFWSAQDTEVPYWVDPGLSAETIGYALVLGVLGASIAGVVPALKVTGKGVGDGLRSITLGGSPLRFGALPTAIIVVQVAMAVAFLPYPASQALSMARYQTATGALAGERILSARLQPAVEGGGASGEEDGERALRFAQRLEELRARLAAEPEVVAVTFGNRVPGQQHSLVQVRVDGSGEPGAGAIDARTAAVAPGYFEALDAHMVAGRAFGPADVDAGAGITVAIANEAFARQVPGGGNVVGRRIRFVVQEGAAEGPWLDLVGIVEDLDVAQAARWRRACARRAASRPSTCRRPSPTSSASRSRCASAGRPRRSGRSSGASRPRWTPGCAWTRCSPSTGSPRTPTRRWTCSWR